MKSTLLRTSARLRAMLLAGATLTCLLAATPAAYAVGRIADIQVIDRDSGEALTVYRHQGEHWVAGRPGARYAVTLRNTSAGRLLAVVSVDGVNAISGETAAWHQTGYVLSPWQSYNVAGWRKSDRDIAAFHFTASAWSYAERTGRPGHVGVIGVALFRERMAPPPAWSGPSTEAPGVARERSSGGAPSSALSDRASAAPPAPAAESAIAEKRAAPPTPSPQLGTGHGAREQDHITRTTFERRSLRPDEIIRIRYDSHDNLVALGIIPARPVPPRPDPFPGGVEPGYTPDPD